MLDGIGGFCKQDARFFPEVEGRFVSVEKGKVNPDHFVLVERGEAGRYRVEFRETGTRS